MTDPKKHRIVAIDTNTLQWAVRKTGSPDKIRHAGYLFAELDRDHAQIILPSIVVAEFLVPISDDARPAVVASLRERFLIEPFDTKDTIMAARLWNYGKANRAMGAPGARVILRADTLIIATAAGHGATEFYTDDEDCFAMASQVMTAKHLPTIAPDLFFQLGGAAIDQTKAETQPGPEAPQG